MPVSRAMRTIHRNMGFECASIAASRRFSSSGEIGDCVPLPRKLADEMFITGFDGKLIPQFFNGDGEQVAE